MDCIRTNTTNRTLTLPHPGPTPDCGNERPDSLKQTALKSAIHLGNSLNAGAETILTKFGELGVSTSSQLKGLEHLTGTAGFLGNTLKIEDTLWKDKTGSSTGILSKIIRQGAGIFNTLTGVLSIAEASATDRMKGNTSYSGTMKAVGKSVGQMTVGALATTGVAVLAPASAPALAIAVVGGTLVTGCMIATGKVLDYIMA